jgi:plastocyanin
MSPSRRLTTCSALGLALVLAIPAAAGAAEKTVNMGIPKARQKAFEPTGSDVNSFFPSQVRIHVGDTVRFVPSGFHTVDLPGSRTRRLQPVAPTGQAIAGSVDAAGAPFWFNGRPGIGFNPVLFASAFGKRLGYTGAKAVLSGVPQGNNPKPLTVRFTKTGSFRFFCDLHTGMSGRVVVVGRGRSVPSAAADRTRVSRQVTAALAVARPLARNTKPPANTIDVGVGGAGGVSYLGFVPAALTVPVGTTVNFRIASKTDFHTATIGPGDPEKEPNSYLGKLVASLNGPTPDPAVLLPSDPPPGPAALTPTAHGNGFWNTGVLDEDSTNALPTGSSVRFAAAGTYQVYCMIHPFMHATVTAQ